MSESARKLENYFINNKSEQNLETRKSSIIEMPEQTIKMAVEHMLWILRQNEGRKLLIPFSGGKDSILTALLALEAHKENPENIQMIHEESSSSPEERELVEEFERHYGVNVQRIKASGADSFENFEPDSWEHVERQFESRHRAMEEFIESGEYVRVLSGNLTEDLLGLLTPTTYTEEDKVLQPITMLFASEVEQLLKQLDAPRNLAIQKSYTSETKQPKEKILGADYKLIDLALWLKLHSENLSGIAKVLGVEESWLRELLVKRVKNRKEVIYPILKEAQGDPLSLGSIPEKLKEQLSKYRWERLKSAGVNLSDLSLNKEADIDTFYAGI